MTHRCLPDGMLGETLALPLDDPRRAAAEACPRCGARLAALDAFLAGDPDLPADEAAAADRALAEFVATGLGPRPQPPQPPRPARAARRFAPRHFAATASLCAAVALAVLLARDAGDPAPIGARLRGEAPVAGAAAIELVQGGPTADGGRALNWRPVAGADHYAVALFSGDLDTLAVLAPLARPTVTLDPALLRAAAAAGGALVRIEALAGDRRLAVSPLLPLSVR